MWEAINLYKDMVNRQDAILKVVKDIRDINTKKNVKSLSDEKIKLRTNKAFEKEKDKISNSIPVPKPHYVNEDKKKKSYKIVGENKICPHCELNCPKEAFRCQHCNYNF